MTIETSLKKGWIIRAMVMIILGYGFAIWAYYDATVAYPARGETYAQLREEYWLRALDSPTLAPGRVAEPRQRLAELNERVRNQEALSEAEQAERAWLRALKVIGELDRAPERVSGPSEAWLAENPDAITGPMGRLLELSERISRMKGQPKPLNSYDIPSQWVILAVGLLIGTWSLVGFIRGARHKYTYDTETGTLTADDETITADEMKDVDKSRWQKKSIAYLVTKDGRRIKLDDWIYAHTEDIVDHLERQLGIKPAEGEEDGEAASAEAASPQDDQDEQRQDTVPVDEPAPEQPPASDEDERRDGGA
jgi:hypothetical protein